ncbi:MAG: NAD(P)/FAD-dependent oxidoreductase [Candidatus Kapaibacterium sp.]
MDFDALIIGAGAIGLAIAENLSEDLSCLIIDRNPAFGMETSSRNSEVIHGGIYYPKGSLKARLCVDGNKLLYAWCDKKNVTYKKTGKYIIAASKDELNELENIYQKGKANGVKGLRRASINEINENEPYVRAAGGLFSQDTGIIDTHSLMKSLLDSAEIKGCVFAKNHSLTNISKTEDGFITEIKLPGGDNFLLKTKYVINSAGLDADTVASRAGIDIAKAGYDQNYCKGHYFKIADKKNYLASHLIYPLPLRKMHSLGIHVTLDLSGSLKLGPDTQFLTRRIQDYSVDETLRDKFFAAASLYLKGLEPEDLEPDYSGIRPKLQKEGGGYRDFIIKEESAKGLPGLINLIGMESPGLTSCLSVANYVRSLLFK